MLRHPQTKPPRPRRALSASALLNTCAMMKFEVVGDRREVGACLIRLAPGEIGEIARLSQRSHCRSARSRHLRCAARPESARFPLVGERFPPCGCLMRYPCREISDGLDRWTGGAVIPMNPGGYAAIGKSRACSSNCRNSGCGARHMVRYVFRKGSLPNRQGNVTHGRRIRATRLGRCRAAIPAES
jgi:hypothetical protein